MGIQPLDTGDLKLLGELVHQTNKPLPQFCG
jgi:hypothetical protein